MVEIKCYLSNKHVGLLKKAQATVMNQDSISDYTTCLVLHLEHFIPTYAQLKMHCRFLFLYIRVSSVPPHKEQATNTSLGQIQTNDIWNYPHSHSQFDILNLNIHLEIHHWQTRITYHCTLLISSFDHFNVV